eukprot:s271_g16.t1
MADGPQWDSGARNCGSGRVAVTIHAQELLRLRLSCTAGTTQATEPRYEAADVDRFPAPSRDDLKGREPYLASYCFRLHQVLDNENQSHRQELEALEAAAEASTQSSQELAQQLRDLERRPGA